MRLHRRSAWLRPRCCSRATWGQWPPKRSAQLYRTRWKFLLFLTEQKMASNPTLHSTLFSPVPGACGSPSLSFSLGPLAFLVSPVRVWRPVGAPEGTTQAPRQSPQSLPPTPSCSRGPGTVTRQECHQATSLGRQLRSPAPARQPPGCPWAGRGRAGGAGTACLLPLDCLPERSHSAVLNLA